MLPLKLKICGMTNPKNVLEVAAVAPDFFGFIFYDKSPRFVGRDFAIPTLEPGIQKVGVFVNEKVEVMIQKVQKHQLNFAQLHGDESVEVCKEMMDAGVKVIKVFSVDDQFDFSAIKPYGPVVDFFLFDTKGKLRGGNGTSFDWSILENYKGRVPFFLSGGIDPGNVTQIQQIGHEMLFAVDINSGVEDSPGLKSKKKLIQFMKSFERLAL